MDASTATRARVEAPPAERAAEPAERPHDLPREIAAIWINCLVILTLSWTAFALSGIEEARQGRRERAALVASTAKGFSEYVGLHLLIADRLLINSRDSFARTGVIPDHAMLTADFGQMAPMLLQVAVADETGRLVASSLPLAPGLSIADRPHFLAFRNDPGDRLYLSQPVVGRVSKKMSLQLVRPLLGPGGEFKGVIVASIDPLLLQQYFNSVEAFAGDGSVTITGRRDGIVRARFTRNDITWGQSLLPSTAWSRLSGEVAGSYEAVSVIDHEKRVVGFHRVADYPLVVSISSRRLTWDPLDNPLALVFVTGFSVALFGYKRARVRRLREQELVIEKLEQSHRREAQANRMKSNFLATISHELRTPLNSVLGFSEIIRDVPHDPEVPRYAGLILDSGRHLLSLLNTLLDLAKIEAGRMEIHRGEVDLGAVLEQVAGMHRGAAQPKGVDITLALDLPAGQRAVMDTDRTKLVQVLNNVLSNAVKFTDAGTIAVTVGVADHEASVRVRDQGRGIAPERMPHIFDRFQTVGSESESQAGTGLGLALSRELLNLLGGAIAIQSDLGQGTEVTIRLPGVRLADTLP